MCLLKLLHHTTNGNSHIYTQSFYKPLHMWQMTKVWLQHLVLEDCLNSPPLPGRLRRWPQGDERMILTEALRASAAIAFPPSVATCPTVLPTKPKGKSPNSFHPAAAKEAGELQVFVSWRVSDWLGYTDAYISLREYLGAQGWEAHSQECSRWGPAGNDLLK